MLTRITFINNIAFVNSERRLAKSRQHGKFSPAIQSNFLCCIIKEI